MKTRREFVKLVGGAAIGTAAVLAAGPVGKAIAAPAKGVPSNPVKIGVIPILTGIAGVPGMAGLRGTQIWAEKVNAEGGILGRQVQLFQEEETNPKDTVEKFRKLTLQNKVDVISGGISTAMMIAKYFPNIKTIAGINNDYSYGRDNWDTIKAVLNHYNPNIKFVLDLWPKLGETEFTSHIAAIKRAAPDLLFSSFWSGDTTIFLKQAAGVGLFKEMKGCFCTGGGVHTTLKKEFTPEGLILGYNNLYFKWTETWPMLKWFVNTYQAKFKEYPVYEADHAYFVLEAYKTAVEKCYAITKTWPTKEQIAVILPEIEVACPSGYRGYTEDNRMRCTFYQGITTHKNPYDFVTIDPVESLPSERIMKPADTKLFDWIKGWKS